MIQNLQTFQTKYGNTQTTVEHVDDKGNVSLLLVYFYPDKSVMVETATERTSRDFGDQCPIWRGEPIRFSMVINENGEIAHNNNPSCYRDDSTYESSYYSKPSTLKIMVLGIVKEVFSHVKPILAVNSKEAERRNLVAELKYALTGLDTAQKKVHEARDKLAAFNV